MWENKFGSLSHITLFPESASGFYFGLIVLATSNLYTITLFLKTSIPFGSNQIPYRKVNYVAKVDILRLIYDKINLLIAIQSWMTLPLN